MTCRYWVQAPLMVIYFFFSFFENILSFSFRDFSNKIFGHGAVTVVTAINKALYSFHKHACCMLDLTRFVFAAVT